MYLIKRNKIFHIYYHDENGKERSKSTKCSTRAEANKSLNEFLNAQKNNKPKLVDISFEDYKTFYLGYAATRFTSNYQKFIGYAFSQFNRVIPNSLTIKEIKTSHVEAFITLKLTEAKEMIVNGYLRTLQASFQRAMELGYLYENVFSKIKKLKYAENKPSFLKPGEFEKIYGVEEDLQLKLIYKFAYYTGMRMAEIRFLKWKSIDFSSNVITVENHNEFTTKSKRSRIIPIHDNLKDDLKIRGKWFGAGEYVFNRNSSVVKKDYIIQRFKRAIKLAGLDDKYHFHTLRHTFASSLVQKGISIYIVSKLLGHADIKTTMIYSHLRTEDLRNAIELLSE